jgi:hypothetical protein
LLQVGLGEQNVEATRGLATAHGDVGVFKVARVFHHATGATVAVRAAAGVPVGGIGAYQHTGVFQDGEGLPSDQLGKHGGVQNRFSISLE